MPVGHKSDAFRPDRPFDPVEIVVVRLARAQHSPDRRAAGVRAGCADADQTDPTESDFQRLIVGYLPHPKRYFNPETSSTVETGPSLLPALPR